MTALRRSAAALATACALVLALSACGPPHAGTIRGCVIVDVSGSARPEITGTYEPGLAAFVNHVSRKGSGDVCFSFAARGVSGGGTAWGHFGCDNPRDELRCAPQIRESAAAAATQLAGVASGPNVLKGASMLLETLALITPSTASGDEILMLTDGIQNSRLTGNFAEHELRLDAEGAATVIQALRAKGLLPRLDGRVLRIPYALTHNSHPLNMSAERQRWIEDFWHLYASETGARLLWGEGTRNAGDPIDATAAS